MWEPICDEPRVWRALEAIADTLATRTVAAADLALFWTYFASVRDDARADAAIARFGEALDYDTLALFGGLAGAGWVAAHIAGDGAGALLETIDARVCDELARWHGTFDLVGGLAGFGVYFLERDHARGLALVVDALARRATELPDGIAWHTARELLPEAERSAWPDGLYDCGVAHGTAGVIGVLRRIAARPDAPPAAASLAADATRWLLAQRDGADFPSQLDRTRRLPARRGWCYGAPGIARALGRVDLADFPATDLDSAELCHGTACMLHLANRTYQDTREPAHRERALAWLDRLLATTAFDPRSDLLNGTAGVGLALLAAATDLEPTWDRRMLCD